MVGTTATLEVAGFDGVLIFSWTLSLLVSSWFIIAVALTTLITSMSIPIADTRTISLLIGVKENL